MASPRGATAPKKYVRQTDRQTDMGRSIGATAPKNVISMWSVLQVRLSKTGGD